MNSEMQRLKRCLARGMSCYEYWFHRMRRALLGIDESILFFFLVLCLFVLFDFVYLFSLFCLKTAELPI